MKKWKLQNRILSLVLLPGLIVSVFLGSFFIMQRMSDLDLLLEERGLAIGKQAASTSEYGVISGNFSLLENLTNNLLEERDLRAARILNKEGQVLAHSGPKMIENYIGNTQIKSGRLQLSKTKDTIRIKAPVFSQNIDLDNNDLEPLYKQQKVSSDLLGWVEIEMSLTNTQLGKYQHLAISIATVVSTLLLCLMLAIRISRSISNPVKDMVACVDNISDGKIDSRVHINSGDEFQTLAAGINAMAIAIQRAKNEHTQNIEQATHDIRETLDTIEIQNIELDIARREAIEASRIKSEFLTNISHEIRTPLNGILGFTRILLKDQADQRKVDHLNTIEKSANGLLSIINDILDFSKIDAGKLVLETIDFNVRETLDEVLTINAPESYKKSLELVSLIYTDVPEYLIGDPLRIKQILTNLISNAIKFTHQGTITVRVMIDDETDNEATIKFSISDTGIGLSAKDKEKLFQSFSQADPSTSRKFGGTGLGLVISQHLVKEMNGDIDVTSAEEEGTTFSFTVTLKKSRMLTRPPTELKGQHVIVLDTASTTKLCITHLVEQWQMRCSDTENHDTLLRLLSNNLANNDPANLVVLGLSRKELYSPETADLIQKINTYNIPIIVLVNSAIPEELEYAQKLGAMQSLAKPIKSKVFFHSLCSCLEIDSSHKTDVTYQNRLQVSAPTILAVDDNEANLKLVTVLLEDMGITVVAAESGQQALTLLDQYPINMVFMDIQMPIMNGIETTQIIRKTKTAKELPIIALTAHAIADDKDKILQAGMNDYQTKPINNEQLMSCIERWTGYHCELDRIENEYNHQNLLAKPLAKTNDAESHTTASIPHNPNNMLESFNSAVVKLPVVNSLATDSEQADCLMFDAKYAMHLANHKLDLAVDMFTMLLESLTEDLQDIEHLWHNQQQEELLQRIHKIHGATKYCGTPCLMRSMKQLEIGLKNTDIIDCDALYQKAILSIMNLQQWAQQNPWQEKLKSAGRS